jgi:hypothetical protein
MAIKTIAQLDPAGTVGGVPVGTSGLKEWTNSDGMYGTHLTADFKDVQAISSHQLLCGVTAGGVCTGSALTVTVPSGTEVYAFVMWTLDANATYLVGDNLVTYLWLCSDGIVRQTFTTTQPATFLRNQCCLLCKYTTVAGVGTMDLSVQDQARTVSALYRTILELNAVNGFGFQSMPDVFPVGSAVTIPANYTARVFDGFVNNGTIVVNGRLRVEAI